MVRADQGGKECLENEGNQGMQRAGPRDLASEEQKQV